MRVIDVNMIFYWINKNNIEKIYSKLNGLQFLPEKKSLKKYVLIVPMEKVSY